MLGTDGMVHWWKGMGVWKDTQLLVAGKPGPQTALARKDTVRLWVAHPADRSTSSKPFLPPGLISVICLVLTMLLPLNTGITPDYLEWPSLSYPHQKNPPC